MKHTNTEILSTIVESKNVQVKALVQHNVTHTHTPCLLQMVECECLMVALRGEGNTSPTCSLYSASGEKQVSVCVCSKLAYLVDGPRGFGPSAAPLTEKGTTTTRQVFRF